MSINNTIQKDNKKFIGILLILFISLLISGCHQKADTYLIPYQQTSFSNGSYSYSNVTIRYDEDSNIFLYDIDDEQHHLNVDLERFDQLRTNTFTTPLDIETFCNISGLYINISTTTGSNIAFINTINNSAYSDRFPYNNITLQLYEGTNTTPVLNRVYARIINNIPTWFVSTSEPTSPHAMVSRVLVGDGCNVYAASLQEDGTSGFAKRVQRVNRKRGLLYEEGMDYNVSSTSIQIGKGNYINSIYDLTTDIINSSETGLFLVDNSGNYLEYSNFSDLMTNAAYSDGNSFGSNKYVNIVIGTIIYDGAGRLYAVIQSKPNTEYTSIVNAYADNDNTLKVYPSDDFLRVTFLPIARMIFNTNSHEAQILPNGLYAVDYRGGIAGGAASGGGIAESDPLSLHYDGSIAPTGDFNWSNYDITNINYISANYSIVAGLITCNNGTSTIQTRNITLAQYWGCNI